MEQPIGIFIRPPLPGTAWIPKIDFHLCRYRQKLICGYLHSSIPRQGTTESDGQALYLGNHPIHHTARCFPRDFDKWRKPGLPCHQGGHIGAVRSRQQIPFPVPRNGPSINGSWPLPDRNTINDLPTRLPPWYTRAWRIASCGVTTNAESVLS